MINEKIFKNMYIHIILLKLSTKYLLMFYPGPSQNSKHFGV